MKTLLLLSVPFVVFAIVWFFGGRLTLRWMPPLIIRVRDRKIFEASAPEDPWELFENDEPVPPYYFREVVWVKNSWLPGGRLEFTGEVWEPTNEREFDVVARQYVLEGCKILART